MKFIKTAYIGSALLGSLLLSACGGSDSSSSSDNTKPTEPPATVEQGRLVFANADTTRPILNVYDLNTEKNIQSIALAAAPSAMYSSPQSRYAVLLGRDQGVVQFVDGGLVNQNNTVSKNTPSLLNFQLNGATPAHYRTFNGSAALFYDGSPTEVSKFDIFNDNAIEKKTISTQKLPKNHHGVAEPRGDYVLSSYMAADETVLSVVKSYELHGDHFHVDQTLTHPCNKLHGAASIQKYAAFGCEDGVLVVEQNGNKFTDQKVLIDQRITTIAGHEKLEKFAAFATGTHALFVVDPKLKQAVSLDWSLGAKEADGTTPVKRLQQVVDATGQYLAILDSAGVVHVINAKTWQRIGKIQAITQVDPIDLAKSRLVVNAASDTVFINDIRGKSIIELDLKNLKIKRTISLVDVPNTFTWVGVAKAS